MKKTITLLFFASLFYSAFGQVMHISLSGGLNVSTYAPGPDSFEGGQGAVGASASPGVGFHAEALFGLSKDRIGIETGLVYENIVGNLNNISDTQFQEPTANNHFNLEYLQVPLNILYYLPNKNSKFYFGAGPYIAFAVSGNVTSSYPGTNYSPQSGKFFFDSADKYDYGFNLKAGIHVIGNFEFGIGFGMGLQPADELKDSIFSFSIGHTIL
jgi:hypothetical protein